MTDSARLKLVQLYPKRGGQSGGEPPMDDMLERLVKVETKLENCASKADVADIKARLDSTATKADLSETKAEIIKWMIGSLFAAVFTSGGLALAVARMFGN